MCPSRLALGLSPEQCCVPLTWTSRGDLEFSKRTFSCRVKEQILRKNQEDSVQCICRVSGPALHSTGSWSSRGLSVKSVVS